MWVHATLVFVAIKTYELFVGHLSWARRERYYGEAGRFARLFGVTDEVLPGTYRSFLGYVRSMEQGEHLAVGDQARSLAVQILHPPVPAVLSVTRPASRAVTAALLPERIRQQFGLGFGIVQRTVVNAVAGSVRGTIRTWPHRLRYWEHYMTASRRTLDSIE
jgi:uncharacterized protein (DUF2236 family)